eukprot:gene16727-19868_t
MTATTVVAEDADDVEQDTRTGRVYTDSSDLEFGYDAYIGGCQAVGIRFADVQVPPGSNGTRIQSAEMVFVADEPGPDVLFDLWIQVVATADCPPFNVTDFAVTSLATLDTRVTWSSAAWSVGATHRTVDFAPLVQEVVDMDGWESGNALCVVVTTTDDCTLAQQTNHYEAESANNPQDDAPLLNITFAEGCASPPPLSPPLPPAPSFPPIPPAPPEVNVTAYVYSTWAGTAQLEEALENEMVATIVVSIDVAPDAALPTTTHTVLVTGICHTLTNTSAASGDGRCKIDGGSQHRLFHVRDGSLTLEQLLVTNGYHADGGGGVFAEGVSAVQILNSMITHCSTDYRGGGVHATDEVTVFIADTSFQVNYAKGDGGALYVQGAGCVLAVVDCTFSGNTADTEGGMGGALHVRDGVQATLNRTQFHSNNATWCGVMFLTLLVRTSNSCLDWQFTICGERDNPITLRAFSFQGSFCGQFGSTVSIFDSTFDNDLVTYEGGWGTE